jgi:hypothetical protein
VAFHPDGSVDIVHDDAPGGAHSGNVPAAQIGFVAIVGGSGHDHRFIPLPCPVAGCGSTTLHPIGGGADAPRVQELFVRVAARLGCACGLVTAGKPIPIVQSHVKLEAERMDGAGRWSAGVLH